MTGTEKDEGKKDRGNGTSHNGIDAKKNGTSGVIPDAGATATVEARGKGPRRQSTRSVKAPKPFSPPMGGIKGVSATARKALATSGGKKASSSTVSLNSPGHGRFMPILYDMIEETHHENQNIISWSRDGKSFSIFSDHRALEETISKYFSHGRLRSLQRQLCAYGFVMEGNTYSHPYFHRGLEEEDLLAIPRKSRAVLEAEEAENGSKRKGSSRDDKSRPTKMPRRHSVGSSKTKDYDEVSTESVTTFAQTIHDMLEENKDPTIMAWTTSGKAFTIDQDHPNLGDVLEKYFHHRNFWSLKRQLNQYGWTKPQDGDYKGTLFNPAFYRNMPAENFDLIRRKDARNYIPLKEQLRLGEKNKKMEEKRKVEEKKRLDEKKKISKKKKKAKNTDPNLRVPPLPAAALAVANAVATAAAPSTMAVTKSKKVDKTVKKTAAKGTSSTTATKIGVKKRKIGPFSAQENGERLKKLKKLSAESLRAQDKLHQNKQLQGLYDAWTLFEIPPALKTHIKKKSKKTWNVAAAASGKEGLGAITANARFLICEEKMPDWLAQGEKETLEELEEMIIRDRRQRQARQDAWSRKYSTAKGKTLPPSKFNRPTNKWKKVSPGDKIDVYWHDDNQYYTANVVKHQEGTSYFHLFHEDDGAMEWLDLSREDFKLLENPNRSCPAISNEFSNGVDAVDDTPQKDNRGLRPNPSPLPENHAHLAPFLRYSWNELDLGGDLGTPTYNKFIKKKDPSAAEVKALEILQDVRALRTRGFSAQADIDLRVDTAATAGSDKLTTMLRDLQDEIAQDRDDGKSYRNFEATLSTIRRVTDHWRVPELIGNMQRLETRVATMDEREARVLERLRRKNLI
ncbi:HSF-type DNA-binding protein [Nitzschia inconspicua]|uniref:HSF-type DNA-binding protein n=1 Tax=Nitzschia inconspicua TaxID=303405 RepID=A0A9K3PEI7_9STRA|nr:HSF-type DNA-binding protein [Nitzschia inconspicua]